MEKRSSWVLNHLSDNTLFSRIHCKLFFKKWADELDEISLTNKVHSKCLHYKFNLNNPRSFNEYLCWLKFNYHNDLWCRCADKIEVKQFLKEIGLEKYVPKTLTVYNCSKEINLDNLPNKFVLKTNHDSGSIYMCDKGHSDFTQIFNSLDKSLKRNYSSKDINHEWVYENIIPKIFAEEILIPESGNDLIDYKFFCFNGKPKFGFIGQERAKNIKFTVFYPEPFALTKIRYIYLRPKKKNRPHKPKCYDEMLDVVKKVASHFSFVRVDMYATSQGPRIGELTFFSQSGNGKFTPTKYDFMFGEYFKDCFAIKGKVNNN